MSRSNPVREVIVTRSARERLSGEEICQALAEHQPDKFFSLHANRYATIVVVTDEEGITQVMVSS